MDYVDKWGVMVAVDENRLIRLVEKMPAFPKSVTQMVHLTSDVNVEAKVIVQVIESDPVMTLKILKVINSSFYGLPQKITSIQRAVIHLGLNSIKNMALTIAALGVLQETNQATFNTRAFLLHSLTTASICRLLAQHLGVSQAESSDFFVAGLLHDFGKIVFAEFMPTEFKTALVKSAEQKSALYLAEQTFIGINHAQVGFFLAQQWELDTALMGAIAHHHDPRAGNLLEGCLFMANQISKKMQFGFAGNPVIEPLPDHISLYFACSLDELILSLGDLSLIKAECLAFVH